MGKIADILQQRGDTEEALRIHLEECLPTALQMKDSDMIAHIRFSCAALRLRRRGLEQGEAETIIQELSESFMLNMKLQRVEGVAVVGFLLGRLLAPYDHVDETLWILDQSAAAFERLKQADQANQVRELQRKLRERKR